MKFEALKLSNGTCVKIPLLCEILDAIFEITSNRLDLELLKLFVEQRACAKLFRSKSNTAPQ